MFIKKYQHVPFQAPPKFTQIGIFGLKINHLATLSIMIMIWQRGCNCRANFSITLTTNVNL
jgi:hypothetical protein